MTESTHDHTRPAGTTAPNEHVVLQEKLQHVSWGAIFLGLIIAIASQILLGMLGIGLGFTILDPSDPMGGIGAWSIGTALYFVLIQIIALFIGGYVAARLARARTDQSAMFHGASIWALATIIMVWLGTTTAGLAISGLSGAVSGVASATSQAAKAVIPDDISNVNLPQIDYLALPEPVRETLRRNGVTANNLQQEVRGAYRETVTRQEQQKLAQELKQTVQDILQSPADALEDIDKAIDDVFGKGGVLSQQDLAEMENALQRRLNLSDQEVQQISNQLQQAATQAREGVKQALKTAKEQAIQAAEAVTSKIGAIAFWMFLANLLGLIAAVFGGKKGEIDAGVVM